VKKVIDCKEVEFKEVLWGGTRNGVPVGGARYYMGLHFYGRCVLKGGGYVGLCIMRAAWLRKTHG
jgi:hypothetical protein